ncbi:hypothetical protein BASA81_006666 [Batrachochytrium salamandrivorans]|nr:hypothetical protein BASA81_006666 [Batrachochytrium salamandrivorans]
MLHCWSESIAYTYQTNATLQQLYRDAKIRHETDPEFALEAKRALVLLQSGQAGLDVWQALVNTSLEYFKQTYSRLGLDVDYSTWFMGESAYQSHMPSLLDSDLIKSCVYGGEEGNDQSIVSTNGVVLRKSDGSIGYDATDVAALLHRAQFSDQILYVVDAGQASHFDKIFDFVRPVIGHVDPVHVKFGLVCRQGEGKIKTREGHSPSLVGLLNDAKEVTKQKLFGCSETLAEHCGTASVCFAELKTNRIQNYEFSLDRVCNPDGDGAMYLFYVLAKLQRQRQHSMLSNSSNRKLQVLKRPVRWIIKMGIYYYFKP